MTESASTSRLALAGPKLSVSLEQGGDKDLATTLQIVLLITVLSLVPAILLMMTSFARIVVVLSFLRQAMATHQMPPNQIIIGLALFLTIFIMTPVWHKVHQEAVQPFLDGKLGQQEALEKASQPLRSFMFKQTREKDLALMVDIAEVKRPRNLDDIPTSVLIPSFILAL